MRDALPVANGGGTKRILRPLLPETGQRVEKVCCCRRNIKKDAGERLPCSLNLFPIHDDPAKAGAESACVSGSEGHAHTEMEAHTRQASLPFSAKRRLRTAPGLMPRAAERQKHEGRTARPFREQQSGRESEEGLSLPSPRLPCRSWGFGGDYLPRKTLSPPLSRGLKLPAFAGCGAAPRVPFPPFPVSLGIPGLRFRRRPRGLPLAGGGALRLRGEGHR